MSEETQLVVIENPNPATLFVPGGLDSIIAQVEAAARSFPQDMDTAKGRREIASVAARVAKSKTLIDDIGKEYVAKLKQLPKQVDEVRRDMRNRLDELKDEIRAPLTAWEKERERQRNARATAVSRIKMLGLTDGPRGELMPTESLREQMDTLMRMQDPNTWKDDPLWEDIKAEAIEAYRTSKTLLGAALVMAEKRDEDAVKAEADKQAQLEERIEREKREAVAAAERRAEQERLAAERRAAEDRERAVEDERRKAQEEAARIERERREQERAEMEAKQEEVRRSRDREHRASRHQAVVASLMTVAGIGEQTAERVVEAIARGEVDHVSISY